MLENPSARTSALSIAPDLPPSPPAGGPLAFNAPTTQRGRLFDKCFTATYDLDAETLHKQQIVWVGYFQNGKAQIDNQPQ